MVPALDRRPPGLAMVPAKGESNHTLADDK